MTNTLQDRFAERCDELLDVMIEQTQKEETWDLYLAKGAGDRAIAGDHEERHLLELLQYARDAIYRGREAEKGSDAPGRVFVAVTEQGMAMANTGDPFRLNDKEVLKAVRYLERVKWICDIPNLVQELNLAEQIGRGVRSGTLPLKLQIGER